MFRLIVYNMESTDFATVEEAVHYVQRHLTEKDHYILKVIETGYIIAKG